MNREIEDIIGEPGEYENLELQMEEVNPANRLLHHPETNKVNDDTNEIQILENESTPKPNAILNLSKKEQAIQNPSNNNIQVDDEEALEISNIVRLSPKPLQTQTQIREHQKQSTDNPEHPNQNQEHHGNFEIQQNQIPITIPESTLQNIENSVIQLDCSTQKPFEEMPEIMEIVKFSNPAFQIQETQKYVHEIDENNANMVIQIQANVNSPEFIQNCETEIIPEPTKTIQNSQIPLTEEEIQTLKMQLSSILPHLAQNFQNMEKNQIYEIYCQMEKDQLLPGLKARTENSEPETINPPIPEIMESEQPQPHQQQNQINSNPNSNPNPNNGTIEIESEEKPQIQRKDAENDQKPIQSEQAKSILEWKNLNQQDLRKQFIEIFPETIEQIQLMTYDELQKMLHEILKDFNIQPDQNVQRIEEINQKEIEKQCFLETPQKISEKQPAPSYQSINEQILQLTQQEPRQVQEQICIPIEAQNSQEKVNPESISNEKKLQRQLNQPEFIDCEEVAECTPVPQKIIEPKQNFNQNQLAKQHKKTAQEQREKLLAIVPAHKADIQNMNDDEIKQIFDKLNLQENQFTLESKSKENNKEITLQIMIKEILTKSPEMKEILTKLTEKDIKIIYNKIVEQKIDSEKDITQKSQTIKTLKGTQPHETKVTPASTSNKQINQQSNLKAPTKSTSKTNSAPQNGKKLIQKEPITKNGSQSNVRARKTKLNISQIRKKLISKLPEYKDFIVELDEFQIEDLFLQSQANDAEMMKQSKMSRVGEEVLPVISFPNKQSQKAQLDTQIPTEIKSSQATQKSSISQYRHQKETAVETQEKPHHPQEDPQTVVFNEKSKQFSFQLPEQFEILRSETDKSSTKIYQIDSQNGVKRSRSIVWMQKVDLESIEEESKQCNVKPGKKCECKCCRSNNQLLKVFKSMLSTFIH